MKWDYENRAENKGSDSVTSIFCSAIDQALNTFAKFNEVMKIIIFHIKENKQL